MATPDSVRPCPTERKTIRWDLYLQAHPIKHIAATLHVSNNTINAAI